MCEARSNHKSGRGSHKLKEKELSRERSVRNFINRIIQYDCIEKKE